jgi:hypothetical protein
MDAVHAGGARRGGDVVVMELEQALEVGALHELAPAIAYDTQRMQRST